MSQNPERLKGLSIRQPWAELILRGEKTEEYRSQPTNIRGRVYVYASQTPAELDAEYREDLESELGAIERLPTGWIVGTVEIIGCRKDVHGGYAWELANPSRLDEPLKPIEHPQPVWFHPFGRPEVPDIVNEESSPSTISSSFELRFNREVISDVPTVATPYHAKYFAFDLTRKGAEGMDRLSMSLFDAAVDLNPHQIEAALFALQSPLSKGVILADEVGLGKTIEAGIVLCQCWAERKRRLLVLSPASIRKQWALDLQEKFNLPAVVLDAKTYRDIQRQGRSPIAEKSVIVMSFNFANRIREELKTIAWDLVVIDEAHKLRNAYRPSNKVGQGIRWATEDCRKLLLTATPLQNSLLELYGLSTLIDEHLFGDVNAFRSQYVNAGANLDALRQLEFPTKS